jgi:excisionase family DNA binding protein
VDQARYAQGDVADRGVVYRVTLRVTAASEDGSPGPVPLTAIEENPVDRIARRATPRPFVSIEEAALLLGESRSTVYRAVKSGSFPLPVVRIGERLRVPRSAIERLIAGEVLQIAYQEPAPSEASSPARPSRRPPM